MYIKKGRPTVARVTVQCVLCGANSVRRVTDLARKKTGRIFCSNQCKLKVGCKPKTGKDAECEICGATFYRLNYSKQRFCSKKCHDVSQTKPKVERVCEVCEAPFSLKPSTAESNAGRFCSRKCMGAASIVRLAGYDHNGRPALIDFKGYVRVWEPSHPQAAHGRVLEHRLIMEKVLGRYLTTEEQVDHVNRIKHENQPDNLQILSASAHSIKTNGDIARDMAELAEYRKRFGTLKPIAA